MSIWVVEDGLASWCSSVEPPAPRKPGVDGLLAYLRSIPHLVVYGETPVTVDGRPAERVDLVVKDDDSGCPQHGIALWRDAAIPSTGQGIWIREKELVRLIMVDVDGATVVFEIWSTVDFDAWLPTAEGIVESIGFLPVPSSDPGPVSSPAPT